MRLNFRTTQLLGYVLVVAIMGIFTIYAGFSFIGETVVKEAKLRVQMDLNSAWYVLNDESTLLQMSVSTASLQESLRNVLNTRKDLELAALRLESLRRKYELDYLTLTDQDGVILVSAGSTAPYGRHVRSDPLIQQALEGIPSHGTVLISSEDLRQKNEELAKRASVPLVPTERARPTDKIEEDRGMALEAAVPIIGANDAILGVVYGGFLLNQRYDLVDKIRDDVFGKETYEGKPLGTVTIFLWDVRVATNVIKADYSRAIGTRVSEEVYEKVLERGERFGDRAFVVNDWYLSAYDPITDPAGDIIGILYVGLLEKKYLDYRSNLASRFLGISLLALLLSVGLAFYLSGTLRRPILKLVNATRELSAGNLETRVSDIEGSYEVAELANSFNSMAESLETRNKQLKEASIALEQALQEADEKNRAYLEMLGFVTHELKSPLASIMFTIGSLRERILGPLNDSQEKILKAASSSADYLNYTIANYLNMSRIEEGALKLNLGEIAIHKDIIDSVIERLSEMAADNDMKVLCDVPYDLKISCDRDLMTSVFQNLLSNAIKYGNEGGKIFMGVKKDAKAGCYKFNILNEGPGFTEEEAKELFTKFSRFRAENFGTKSGTGVGLFVTKGIIEKHGGKIWAESEPGEYANFLFTVPY